MKKYLALLRGINVGGNNIIKMSDLKESFEKMGFKGVKTYIQSGNVIFSSEDENKKKMIEMIEETLSEQFNYQSKIVLLSKEELQSQLLSAPKDYGENGEKYKHDVIFLKETITVDEVMRDIKLREGVDEVFVGNNVLFFRRTFIDLTKSKLIKFITSPVYQHITIRNWNTSTKLLKMMNE